MDDFRRLFWSKQILLIGMFACMALCWQLWVNARPIPLLPLWEGMPGLKAPVHLALLGITSLAALFSFIWVKKSWPGWIFIGGMVIVVVQDWNRMQPWMFHFLMLFIILQSLPHKYRSYLPANPVMSAMQLGFAAIYFWSGFYKLNDGFTDRVIPYVLFPVTQHLVLQKEMIHQAGAFIPYLEMATAIALLIPKIRLYGILAATSIHLGILFLLGPLGLNANEVVWPWNVVSITLLFLLFFQNKNQVFSRSLWRIQPIALVAMAAVVIFPILNTTGYYNKSISFELYSGTNYTNHLRFSKKEVRFIPGYLEEFSYNYKDSVYIKTYDWALRDIGTPPNPDPKVTDQWQRKMAPILSGKEQ